MNDPVEKLITFISAFNPRAPSTITQYRRVSKEFLRNAQNPPAQEDVLHYIAGKNAQATKRWCYWILRKLFEANTWEWPFQKGSVPRVRDQKRIQLTPEEIKALAEAAIELGDEEGCLYLSLCSTYGFRRAELAKVTQGNFNNGSITLQSVHRGLERIHTVPDTISRFTQAAPEEPVTVDRMVRVFNRACKQAGLTPEWGTGWHSIRRALVSRLSLVVPSVVIVRFMGWQQVPEHQMLYVYARPVGLDVDKVVFAEHPFLSVWKDERRVSEE